MRFCRLKISNFKAITELDLDNLGDVVVIAGPNGCGKSCIFDAIRLLKSAYGGYQANEVESWFGEFQIDIKQQGGLAALFQDVNRPVRIRAEVALSNEERDYLLTNAGELIRQAVWREVDRSLNPRLHQPFDYQGAMLSKTHRSHKAEVDKKVDAEIKRILKELRRKTFVCDLVLRPDLNSSVRVCRVMELVFGIYDSRRIGIIDYHGPHRNYVRERIGGINLSIESSDSRLRESALYNYANKYSNLKSEMAAGYVRQLLAKEVKSESKEHVDLTRTLAELFRTFFPGKEFLGPQPTADGKLLFQVKTESGTLHDLDELSSGEKEVLYGYLRIRNAAPKHSMLLIDEPELHLNPRLIRGLPIFYHKHLGKALGNQLWLVTHSDALLRDCVGHADFRVFHMQPPGAVTLGRNQAAEVRVTQDIERAVIDLVGDLAAYRPGAKVVIFEGGGDTEFDKRMCSALFPTFQSTVNILSAGDKPRVRDLHDLLERARKAGTLPMKVYSVTDRDSDATEPGNNSTRLQWDVYHIENYLLENRFILRVLQELELSTEVLTTEKDVELSLCECAKDSMPQLVRHQLEREANSLLVKCIRTATDRQNSTIAVALSEAIAASHKRLTGVITGSLLLSKLKKREQVIRAERQADLKTGAWRKTFRGRDVLHRFVGKYVNSRYEEFRNLIIARMRDASFEPQGMKNVIQKIQNDPWD